MNNQKIAHTAYIGCKWVDLQNCKWYEFSKKAKLKRQMKNILKKLYNL